MHSSIELVKEFLPGGSLFRSSSHYSAENFEDKIIVEGKFRRMFLKQAVGYDNCLSKA